MKLLIPPFKVNGISSYPDGVTSVIGGVDYHGTYYYLVDADDDAVIVGSVPYSQCELDCAKDTRIDLIKQEAADRITATDWKVQRAKERISIGTGTETELITVYNERDKIRADSDIAEESVLALTSIDDVQSFTW